MTLQVYSVPGGSVVLNLEKNIDSPLSIGQEQSTKSLYVPASRDALITDNSNILINGSASNYTITIQSGMPVDFGFILVQGSTGTLTIAAGAGVTFIGTTLATVSAGNTLSIIWTNTNTYVIKAA